MRIEMPPVTQTYDYSLARMQAKSEEVHRALEEQAERAVIATIESILDDGKDGLADLAAHRFLVASRDNVTARRRAFMLLQLAARRS